LTTIEGTLCLIFPLYEVYLKKTTFRELIVLPASGDWLLVY